jgi:hypothetical protein
MEIKKKRGGKFDRQLRLKYFSRTLRADAGRDGVGRSKI